MEMGSIYTQLMIEQLLKVHALTNMHRSSDNDQYRKSAANWLPSLKNLMVDLERELTKSLGEKGGGVGPY